MADPERLLRAKRLLRVFDVRPVDPFSGMREPAADYKMHHEAPLCVRCGREHVKVYEVECDDGQSYQVGSSCVSRTFGGWQPDKGEITRATSAATKARKAAEEAQRKAWVADAVKRVLGVCPVPPAAPPVVFSEPPYAHLRDGRTALATLGEPTPTDPFAQGVFVYVPTKPRSDQSESSFQRERTERLGFLPTMWAEHAAKQCMQQVDPGFSPTGVRLEGWSDPGLSKWRVADEVQRAVRKAWGR